MELDRARIAAAVRTILEAVGEDPDREGLRETPKRVARMYEEIFSGVGEEPAGHLEVVFNEHHEELVLVRQIGFHSLCEHHLLPFFGYAHVAYMPRRGRVTGLSKLARVVDTYARRPQVQERLTDLVADTLVSVLAPHGVLVIVDAEHMCMSMRGVKKPGSRTVTTAARGHFVESPVARREVLQLIQDGGM